MGRDRRGCGPKGQHNRRRAAVRHGTGKGSVTSAVAGCRWIGRRHARSTVTRRRSPGTCDFAADDVLTQVVTERMLAGVAMRRHAGTAEPVGTQVEKAAKPTSR